PGAHVGAGADKGIEKIIEGLNESLLKEQDVQIALETMAGKGTEIGRSFDEIAKIIDGVTHNEHLRVCLDTCHIHDAGYDVTGDFDKVLTEFDKIIGLDRIKVVHINDSKNEQNGHRYPHDTIGFGYIGFDTLHRFDFYDVYKDLPKILETPFVGEDKKNKQPPYAVEIAMLKQGKFDNDL